MEPPLRQIIGVHGARMYYNLTSIHSVLRSAPFGELLARSFNQFVGAEETAPTATRWRPAYRRAPGAASSRAIAAQDHLAVPVPDAPRRDSSSRRSTHYAARTIPSAAAEDASPSCWTTSAASSTSAAIAGRTRRSPTRRRWSATRALQRLLARAFPGRDQQSLHNTLLKALPDLVSSVPPMELWELSRMIRADAALARARSRRRRPAEVLAAVSHAISDSPRSAARFEDYLDDWGFRCSAELMLTTPSFQEEPEPVIELLKAYVGMDGESPADLLERQEAERLARDRTRAGAVALGVSSCHRRIVASHPAALDAAVDSAARARAAEAGAALQPAAPRRARASATRSSRTRAPRHGATTCSI